MRVSPSHRDTGRTTVRALFTLAVSALALWFLFRILTDVGLDRLGSRLAGAHRGLVAAALAITVIRFALLGARWEILVRREAPAGLAQILRVLMAGNFLSLVTPALRVAGPILRAWYLSKETGKPRARFYGTIVADQASNFTVYALAAALTGGMVALPAHLRISPAIGAAMVVALVLGLWAVSLVLRRVHEAKSSASLELFTRALGSNSQEGWRGRLIRWVDHLVRSLSASVVGSGAWWPSLLLSGAIFVAVAAVQMIAFAAIGAPISFIAASFAVAGAGFVQVMAASPGGAGVTEISLIAVLLAIGIDQESAAAGVLLARFANYAVLLPWGGWTFFRLERRYGLPSAPSEPQPEDAAA